jgi:hypothetical protein
MSRIPYKLNKSPRNNEYNQQINGKRSKIYFIPWRVSYISIIQLGSIINYENKRPTRSTLSLASPVWSK